MSRKVVVHVSLAGELAQRFRAYIEQNWPKQKIAPAIMQRAIREFLDREVPPKEEVGHDNG